MTEIDFISAKPQFWSLYMSQLQFWTSIFNCVNFVLLTFKINVPQLLIVSISFLNFQDQVNFVPQGKLHTCPTHNLTLHQALAWEQGVSSARAHWQFVPQLSKSSGIFPCSSNCPPQSNSTLPFQHQIRITITIIKTITKY